MIIFTLRWRNLLLVVGMCLFLIGQSQSAHAAGFIATTGIMVTERDSHTSTRLDDGRVLITGGKSGTTTLDSAEIYDPATGNFTATYDAVNNPAGKMFVARRGQTATKLPGGKVLITGGYNGTTYQATAEIFDPAGNGGKGTFTLTAPMNVARSGHIATLISGTKVLIAGGQNSTSSPLLTAEIFDPAGNSGAGTFTATGNMGTGRRLCTATLLLDGRVLIAGGGITNSVSTSASNVTNTAEIYTPAVGTFAPVTAPMTSNRREHTASLLTDGRVLIAGGIFSSNSLMSAEIFDPAGAGSAGTFTATENMGNRHYNHTATRLSSGKVLISGGNPSAFDVRSNSAEIFNPAAGGSFSPAETAMTTARAFHTAEALTNGTILLSGGNDITFNDDTAELYIPAGIDASPAAYTFPDTVETRTSPPQIFTISNVGSTALTLNSIAITGSDFTKGSGTCAPPQILSAGGSCTVSVTFTPASFGTKSASLDINSSDPAIPTLSVTLSGNSSVRTSNLITVNFSGTGGGSTSSAVTGLNCLSGSPPSSCQAEVDFDEDVTILYLEDNNSLFNAWANNNPEATGCSGIGDCIIDYSTIINMDTIVTATFDYVKPARIAGTDLYYDTIASAYSNAVAGHYTNIRLREFQFTESAPVFDDGGAASSITITGGFNKDYSGNSGLYSVMSGMTVKRGRVNVSNIIISK